MENKPGFFPMFMDVREKKIVFIGAGKIATRRIKVLAGFQTKLTVVAPTLTDELADMLQSGDVEYIPKKMTLIHTKKDEEISLDELSADIVFACTDDNELNHDIYTYCKEHGILVNNCSNHDECDFYFPGLVKKENIVVGVNAGGNAHAQAKQIREKIEEIL